MTNVEGRTFGGLVPPPVDEARWREIAWQAMQLLDAFYNARIHRPGSDQEDAVHTAAQARFSDAQEILDGRRLDGVFANVQRSLGLLQTVILYGLPDEDERRDLYRLQHLESLRVPWLVVDPATTAGTTWQTHPAERINALSKVFKNFREDPTFGVKEFAHLLGAAGHRSHQGQLRLSNDELRLNCLLVTDEEQSFFSLLYTLLEAGGDAGSLDGLERWVRDERTVGNLRSILRQDDLDHLPAEGISVRRLDRPNDHYWEPASFLAAMDALGLAGPDGTVTPRFERLQSWVVRAPDHVCLTTLRTWRNGRMVFLSELLGECSTAAPSAAGIDRLQQLATTLARVLNGSSFTAEPARAPFIPSDELRVGIVRFNLPGEYLLRRNETISRTFFATPLSTVSFGTSERIYATAFAIGTLLDVDERDGGLTLRIAILRQLSDAIAQFGLSHRLNQEAVRLEVARKDKERVKWYRHELFTALQQLQSAIDRLPVHSAPAQRLSILQGRFDNVNTLFEYVAGRTSPDTKWRRNVPEMLSTLVRFLDGGDSVTFLLSCGQDCTGQYHDDVARQIYIVLLNLADNATKCAGTSGTVTLACRLDPATGDTIVWVENSGATMETRFSDYLSGASDVVPMRRSRQCEGLQTVRHVLDDLNQEAAIVEAPAQPTGDAHRQR